MSKSAEEKGHASVSNYIEKADVSVEAQEEYGVLDTIEDTKPGSFVWLCAAATAIGGMLFGCEYKWDLIAARRLLT